MPSRLLAFVISLLIILVVGVALSGGYSFGLSRFFAAEPGVTNEEASPSPEVTAEQIVGFCSPQSTSVVVGAVATLRSRASTAQWFAPDGSPTEGIGTAFDVGYATTGTKKVTVQIPRTDGSLGVDSGVCTINVIP